MSAHTRPLVGVAVLIHDQAGNLLMGERLASHGTGTLQCPGGHLEHGESFAACAVREAREETGLEVGRVSVVGVTGDVFLGEGETGEDKEGKGEEKGKGKGKHYVTVFVRAEIVGGEGVAKPMEPHKCAKWEWIPWSQMWAWAQEQAHAQDEARDVVAVGGRKLFLPLVSLWREYPEMKDALVGR